MAPDPIANYSLTPNVPDAPETDALDDDFGLDTGLDPEDDGAHLSSAAPGAIALTLATAADEVPRAARMPAELAGERLDKALARLFPQYSRSRLQAWLDEGRVTVEGTVAKPKQSAIADSDIEVTPAASPEMLAFRPEPIALPIIAEDETLV